MMDYETLLKQQIEEREAFLERKAKSWEELRKKNGLNKGTEKATHDMEVDLLNQKNWFDALWNKEELGIYKVHNLQLQNHIESLHRSSEIERELSFMPQPPSTDRKQEDKREKAAEFKSNLEKMSNSQKEKNNYPEP